MNFKETLALYIENNFTFGSLWFDFTERVNDPRLIPIHYKTFQLKLIDNLKKVGCQNRMVAKFRKDILGGKRKLTDAELLNLVGIFCDYFPDRIDY